MSHRTRLFDAMMAACFVAFLVLVITIWTLHKIRADEREVRRDCTYDALKLCKLAVYSGDRFAIVTCMAKNMDRLRVKCRKHVEALK